MERATRNDCRLAKSFNEDYIYTCLPKSEPINSATFTSVKRSLAAAEKANNSFHHGRNPCSSRNKHSIEGRKNVETFEITSSSQLRQCVVIDSRSTCIEFRSHAEFPDFQGIIKVEFPTLSVLGKEKIFFEIIPETIVRKHNLETAKKTECDNTDSGITTEKKFTAGKKLETVRNGEGVKVDVQKRNGQIVTPILHVDRQNGARFLRPVKVTLPLMKDETLQRGIKQSKLKIVDRVTIEDDNNIQISQTKFSPVAGVYDRVRSLLGAFCFTGDSSLDFETKGIHFIAKQENDGTVEIDLRKFRNWQEHRKYRMDETALYFLAVNPAAVESHDHDSGVIVSLSPRNPSTCFGVVYWRLIKTVVVNYIGGKLYTL